MTVLTGLPCNFSLSLPNPLPPVSGGYVNSQVRVTFLANISNVDGRQGQIYFVVGTNVMEGYYFPSGGTAATIFSFSGGVVGGAVVGHITHPDSGWSFYFTGAADRYSQLDVIGNDVAPWNSRTFESYLTNTNTGASEPLLHPPFLDTGWSTALGLPLNYRGQFYPETSIGPAPAPTDPTNAQRYGIILRGDTGIWRVTAINSGVMSLTPYELPQHNIRETAVL